MQYSDPRNTRLRTSRATLFFIATLLFVPLITISHTVKGSEPLGYSTNRMRPEPDCAGQSFSGISRAMWSCFKDAVSLQMHFQFPAADTGQVSGDGAKVDYRYDSTSRTLFLTVIGKSLFVSCTSINQRIGEFLDDCRGPQVRRVQQDKNSETWRIDGPNVKQADTSYQQIRVRPLDRVRLDTAGCVQTGGSGNTWRLYLDPRGPNSDRLYHGLIKLPGMANSIRIHAFLTGGNNYQVPPKTTGDMTVHLGYEDNANDYANNGYWGHDDGADKQCKGIGKAWVQLTIYHP